MWGERDKRGEEKKAPYCIVKFSSSRDLNSLYVESGGRGNVHSVDLGVVDEL